MVKRILNVASIFYFNLSSLSGIATCTVLHAIRRIRRQYCSRRSNSDKSVLQIRDILVRIRIRGSVPLSIRKWFRIWIRIRILLFSSVIIKMPTKFFFVYYFLKLHLHHFSKIKSHNLKIPRK
jgi:hypothetical protein